jgi:hypothetical protein
MVENAQVRRAPETEGLSNIEKSEDLSRMIDYLFGSSHAPDEGTTEFMCTLFMRNDHRGAVARSCAKSLAFSLYLKDMVFNQRAQLTNGTIASIVTFTMRRVDWQFVADYLRTNPLYPK